MSIRGEQGRRPWFRQLDSASHRLVQRFVDEHGTGSVHIHVKEGRIQEVKTEQHHRIRRRPPPMIDA